LVAEDFVDTSLAKAAVDLVTAAAARGEVVALVGVGKGGSAAFLLAALYHIVVVAKTGQDLIGTQTALHFIRAGVSLHGIPSGAAAYVIGPGEPLMVSARRVPSVRLSYTGQR
jgi:hypothetical protein